jgi:hypothetical protein
VTHRAQLSTLKRSVITGDFGSTAGIGGPTVAAPPTTVNGALETTALVSNTRRVQIHRLRRITVYRRAERITHEVRVSGIEIA